MSAGGYHETRLAHDPRREVVWQSLWRYYFRSRIDPASCVVDLGCGYGDFINSVRCRRRIAIDSWPCFPQHVEEGVETIVGSVTDLSELEDGSVDYAFASNLLEHLHQTDISAMLDGLRKKLTSSGTLTVIQPNWRYAVREYFDDYTHVSVWSHVSLADFFAAQGWQVLEVVPRFLPLTVKSRMPVHPWLIAGWLASPLKPTGKQMLLRVRPASGRTGGA